MICLDTANSAYSFRGELLALVKRPTGWIALNKIADVLGLCGTYEIHEGIKKLQTEFAGLWCLRKQGHGYILQCSQQVWPAIEQGALDYLRQLEAGRKP